MSMSATVVAAVVLAGLAILGYYGWGPLGSRLGVTTSQVQPEAVQSLGQGGDPLVVAVLFPWPGGGYCSGQFTVTATETSRQVQVGEVTSREVRGSSCAGLGTVDGMAAADLALTAPLADREVVRDSDGARLPVLPDTK
jgi:hypothetical protein